MQEKNKANQRHCHEDALLRHEGPMLPYCHLFLAFHSPCPQGDSCRKILLKLDHAHQRQTTLSLQHSDIQLPTFLKLNEPPPLEALYHPCLFDMQTRMQNQH